MTQNSVNSLDTLKFLTFSTQLILRIRTGSRKSLSQDISSVSVPIVHKCGFIILLHCSLSH